MPDHCGKPINRARLHASIYPNRQVTLYWRDQSKNESVHFIDGYLNHCICAHHAADKRVAINGFGFYKCDNETCYDVLILLGQTILRYQSTTKLSKKCLHCAGIFKRLLVT